MAQAAWIGLLGWLVVGAPVAAQEGINTRPSAWAEWPAARGVWAEHHLPASGDRVRVYTPAAHGVKSSEAYPLLIAFDARFGGELPTSAIVDVLVGEERIAAPLIVVMDATPSQARIEEVVHWLSKVLRAETDAAHVIVAGAGERGVMAAKLALAHPELIGNVLLLSDGIASDELTRELTTLPRRRVRFAVAASSDVADLRAALEAKGYSHHIARHSALHDTLASGIAFLLNPRFALR